jgi:hypothetical protein
MRRVKITVEVELDIVDQEALENKALADIDATEFTGGDTEKNQERSRVLGHSAAAVEWLLNPFKLTDGLAGAEAADACHFAIDLDATTIPAGAIPDFTTLFPTCRCGKDSCDSCSRFQLTPRTAYTLWSIAQLRSDAAYDDIERHGDEPMQLTGDWAAFDEYPRISWGQNAVWRRQAARAFDDLAGDLADGGWPQPTCPGEEMALHLVLDFAEGGGLELLSQKQMSAFPAHPDDLDWDAPATCRTPRRTPRSSPAPRMRPGTGRFRRSAGWPRRSRGPGRCSGPRSGRTPSGSRPWPGTCCPR